jgi:micrococcal nuclease
MHGQRTLSLGVVLAVLLAVATSAPAAAPQLPVTLVSITSPVNHGKPASISVKTAPGAACRIAVTYKSGPSRAKGLTPKTSDDHGTVGWTWLVGTRTTPGTWPVSVYCSAGGRTGTLQTSIVVQ